MNREVAQDQILRDVLRLLRRQKWVIIGTMLLAVAAAVAYSLLKTKEYEATAQIQFVDQSQYLSTIGTAAPFSGQTPAQTAAQGAERVTSAEVVSAVAQDVNSDLSESEIKDSVETAVNPDSSLVSLTVTAESAKLAADLANAFAIETKNVLTERQRSQLLSQARSLSSEREGARRHLNRQADLPAERRTASVGREGCNTRRGRQPGHRAGKPELSPAREGRSLGTRSWLDLWDCPRLPARLSRPAIDGSTRRPAHAPDADAGVCQRQVPRRRRSHRQWQESRSRSGAIQDPACERRVPRRRPAAAGPLR